MGMLLNWFHETESRKKGRAVAGKHAASQDLIEIGNRIQNRRAEARLSQKAVAREAGISAITVSRIEGGQTAMSIEIFMKLVKVLGADADELLGRTPAVDGRLRDVFSRIQHLKQCEQAVILQTVETLVDGLCCCKQ